MRTDGKPFVGLALLAALVVPSYALAQDTPKSSDPKPEGQLPPSRSDHDPVPPPAAPINPNTTIVKQAGIGGPVAYGRSGVLELGGSASFSTASDFTELSIRPSVGWFVANNLELSAIVALNYISVDDAAGDSASETTWSLLAEPSYHLPLSGTMWLFAGLGLGVTHFNGQTGFAMAPRLGMNFLVGRSGILTPALLLQYNTNDDEGDTADGGAPTDDNTTFGLSIGYTVMW